MCSHGQEAWLWGDGTLSVSGKPIMIITEFMENGALDAFLKVKKVEGQLGREP